MFDRMMMLAGLTLYTALVGVLLVYYNATLLLTLAALSVLPIVVLWRLERLQTRFLVWVSVAALTLAVGLSVFAYVNGVWYETTSASWRLFGLIPLEAFVAAFVHIVYFVVGYEYFFDDRKTTNLPRHANIVLCAAVTSLAAAVYYAVAAEQMIVPYAFAWLVAGVVAVMLVMIGLLPKRRGTLVTRVGLFALTFLPISLVFEYVALSNNLRFFANPQEYVYTFTLAGQLVPVEELFFILLVPAGIALVYEWCIDDGR